jgi:hypothetical protein
MERGLEPRGSRGAPRRLVTAVALGVVAFAAVPSGVAGAAAPVASFSISPPQPLTGQPVAFTSTSSGTVGTLTWDLDADGQFNDGSGPTAQRAFATPGRYLVSLRASGPAGTATQSQWVQVANRPPLVSFSFTPSVPLTDDVVSFAAAASDPDGSIAAISWDLNGDGVFSDATGPVASIAVPSAGAFTVSVAVTDNSGATTVASQGVAVARRPPTMLQPFPIVRLTTRSTRRGVDVLRLGVQAPPGSRVSIHCRGRGCGTRVQVRAARTPTPVRFRALEHRMRPGVVIEIRITAPGRIGKFTRIRLRRSGPPSRVDLCLPPGQGPAPCEPT